MPIGLGRIVQALEDKLVAGLPVQRRAHRGQRPVALHIAVIVFPYVGFRVHPVIPLVQLDLVIPPVAGLEQMEIQPGGVLEPLGGGAAAEGMEADQLVRTLFPQAAADAVEILRSVAAPYVAAHQPDHVFAVPEALRQKIDVGIHGISGQLAGGHKVSPGGQQRHHQSHFRRRVHKLPHHGPIGLRRCIGIGPGKVIIQQGGRARPVPVIGFVHQGSLDEGKAFFRPVFQVHHGFLDGQLLKQQPGRVSQPEKGVSIPKEIAAILG